MDRSQVYGGRWDNWTRRYSGQEPDLVNVVEIPVSRKQYKIITDPRRHRLVHAGRGGGKSHALAVWALIMALSIPHGSGQLFSPSGKKSETLWNKLLNDLPTSRWLRPGDLGIRKQPLRMTFINGFRLGFETAVARSVGRGEDNDILGFDERADIPQKTVNDAILTCRKRAGYHVMQIGTPDLSSDFYEEYERYSTQPATHAVDGFTSYDNPFSLHDVFRAQEKIAGVRYVRQEIYGEWVSRTGRVYPMFSRALHVLKERRRAELLDLVITENVLSERFDDVNNVEFVVGVDYPRTAVVGRIYQDGRSTGLYICDEINLDVEATPWTLAHELKRRGYENAVIFDDIGHGDAGSVSEPRIMRSQGFVVVHGTKNPRIKDRINSVCAKLESSDDHVSLQIDPRCPKLIKAFERQNKCEVTGQPEKGKKGKGYDHALDALGYLVWRMWPIRSLIEPERLRIASEMSKAA